MRAKEFLIEQQIKLADILKEISQDPWSLYENKGPVEFRKSSIFDQTVANKSQQAPNLLAKISSFVDAKSLNPLQPWGSRDKPFGAKGPIGMSMPKLRYAHINNDLIIFYEMEGRDPTVIKLYGVFSHDDVGIGQPGSISKQKSLIQQLRHQRI